MNLQDSYKKIELFIKNGIVNNTIDPRVHFYAQAGEAVIPMENDARLRLNERLDVKDDMIIWRVVVKHDGSYTIVCEKIF